ncbi:MAG: MATE family efflux transporter [Alphaproteobacteria bacterium]|nr:MATE family efflux transporter [Alphaproteobacteria bacterium]
MQLTLRDHLSELLRLAAPVVVARTGILTMATADIVMLGHYNAEDVAWYGIGITPFIVLLLIGIGLLTGTLVMTSHARGAGRPADCGPVWRRSLPYALLIGLIGTIICRFTEPFFLMIGLAPAIAIGGGAVTAIAGLALAPTLIHSNSTYFMEGLARPLPGMTVILFGNLLNLLLNWLLIFGHWGFPAMGAEGAIIATSIVRCVMATALAGYIWWMPDQATFGIRRPLEGRWWRGSGEQWRLGYAAGVSQGVESAAFNSLTLMAGLLGPVALASYSISLNVTALIFMLALGFGAATAVRVGAARGAGDHARMVTAGWIGLGATTAVMIVLGVLLWVFRNEIAAFYTSAADLRMILPALFTIIALFLIADGGQVVMTFALRGAGDAWLPTAIHLMSFFVVMIPSAWILAFPMGMGVRGLMIAIAMGAGAALLALSLRFRLATRGIVRVSGKVPIHP